MGDDNAKGHSVKMATFMIVTVIFLGCTVGKPEIIEQKCSTCHPSALVYQQKRPLKEWDRLLYGMKARGLKVTPQEEKGIREILASQYSNE
jgi:hypothetical protein